MRKTRRNYLIVVLKGISENIWIEFAEDIVDKFAGGAPKAIFGRVAKGIPKETVEGVR